MCILPVAAGLERLISIEREKILNSIAIIKVAHVIKWKYITASVVHWKFKFILRIYLSDIISPVIFSSFIYEYNINKPIVVLKNDLKEGTVWKLPCGLHFLAAPSYLFHHDFFFHTTDPMRDTLAVYSAHRLPKPTEQTSQNKSG